MVRQALLIISFLILSLGTLAKNKFSLVTVDSNDNLPVLEDGKLNESTVKDLLLILTNKTENLELLKRLLDKGDDCIKVISLAKEEQGYHT
ncbi:MAG TPA: hypothetical protein VEK06_01905, partial [Myxococcota bacterium]|nr:hypothetical protein [Myxococcota bacterium]